MGPVSTSRATKTTLKTRTRSTPTMGASNPKQLPKEKNHNNKSNDKILGFDLIAINLVQIRVG